VSECVPNTIRTPLEPTERFVGTFGGSFKGTGLERSNASISEHILNVLGTERLNDIDTLSERFLNNPFPEWYILPDHDHAPIVLVCVSIYTGQLLHKSKSVSLK
jgi:hypothetical protein